MALSTYLPFGSKNAEEMTEESKTIPVFMAHGKFDQVVPMGLGEYSRQQLQQLGLTVQFKTYPMQHNVCPEEIQAIADWLSNRFSQQ
jgi:phospholipase/carboxylesterase